MNQCRECLAELPPGAVHCPKCGRKLGPSVTLQSSTAPVPVPAGNWRVAMIVFGVACVFILLVVIGLVFDRGSDGSVVPAAPYNVVDAAPSPAPAIAPVVTTAEELDKAYDENGLAARDRFEGRPIRVTGTVLRIGSNSGEPTLSLKSSHVIQAAFVDPAPLKALKAGEQITITCDTLAEAAAVLGLSGCMLNTQREPAAPVDRRGGPQ